MKNGVAYGDGLTGYVLKDGMYYGYMPYPLLQVLLWKDYWDNLSDEYVQKTLIHALSDYNMLHIKIYSATADTSIYLSPIHIIMARDTFDSSSSDNPVVCTFKLTSDNAFRSIYMYKVSDTSIAVRQEGDRISSTISVDLRAETV
jgi:hypothetical protein